MACDDLERVRDEYTSAAVRAAEAGFDLLQLDMAHGGLLASFLSPLTNLRDDQYGGGLRQRMGYPLQVLDAVRSVWPEERPLVVAISASDWQRGGLRLADGIEIARELRQHGCDLVAVSAGQTTPNAQPRYDFETLAGYADIVRNEAGVPIWRDSLGRKTTTDTGKQSLAFLKGDIITDLVQLLGTQQKGVQEYGVQKSNVNGLLWIGLNGYETNDSTETGIPAIRTVRRDAAGAQAVYLDADGLRVFTVTSIPSIVTSNGVDTPIGIFVDVEDGDPLSPAEEVVLDVAVF